MYFVKYYFLNNFMTLRYLDIKINEKLLIYYKNMFVIKFYYLFLLFMFIIY